MKTFPEYFQDSIDMTDGSVTITKKDYKAIQLDASQSGYERGLREAVEIDSPTWPHVLAFAKRMEAKLEKNRHKGDREGWLKDDPWSLVERILDETVEVQQCFTMGSDGRIDFKDAEELADECADVANFCMMVADSILTKPKDKE